MKKNNQEEVDKEFEGGRMEEEVYGGREERPPLRLLLSDQSKVVRVKCVVIRAGFLRQG